MTKWQEYRAEGKCGRCGGTPLPNESRCQRCKDMMMRFHTPASPEKKARQYRRRKQRLRAIVFDHYGRECACPGCNVIDERFLTIDHIDGRTERGHTRDTGMYSVNLMAWLRRNDFPDDFQVLCWNCNSARAIYGECPHMLPPLTH